MGFAVVLSNGPSPKIVLAISRRLLERSSFAFVFGQAKVEKEITLPVLCLCSFALMQKNQKIKAVKK